MSLSSSVEQNIRCSCIDIFGAATLHLAVVKIKPFVYHWILTLSSVVSTIQAAIVVRYSVKVID